MATGGAAALARLTGLSAAVDPLVVLAGVQAFAIPTLAARRHGSPWAAAARWWSAAAPAQRFGDCTIPLGCATVATGAAVTTRASWAGAAGGFVIVAHRAPVARVPALAAALTKRPSGPGAVDGVWFLAPAALLGNALGLVALGGRWSTTVFDEIALAEAVAGVVGYALVVVAAGVRVARSGLGSSPRAPWWIAAGCGGLAAAATGELASLPVGATRCWLTGLTVAVWLVGTAALVPILIQSIRYASRVTRVETVSWTPTFSTAVYALGTFQVARLGGTRGIDDLAHIAGYATVVAWAVTVTMWCILADRWTRG